MDFNLYLDKYLQDKNESDNLYLIMGCMQQYLAAEDEEKKQKFFLYLKHLTEGSKITARNLFVLNDAAEDESYRGRIEDGMAAIRQHPKNAEGIFCDAAGEPARGEFLYEAYPFYMEYETRFHNKADYAAIVHAMGKLEAKFQDVFGWEDALFLMTLVDALDGMSKEIFEHYKSLEEIFKRSIKKCISRIKKEKPDLKAGLAMGYVIAKACSIKVLNSEKYIKYGLDVIAGEKEIMEAGDADITGLYMMADSMRYQFTDYK